jgi:hypothetical protein
VQKVGFGPQTFSFEASRSRRIARAAQLGGGNIVMLSQLPYSSLHIV